MVEGKPLVDLIRPSPRLSYRKPIHIAIGLWVDFSKKKVLHFKAMSRSIDLGHMCARHNLLWHIVAPSDLCIRA